LLQMVGRIRRLKNNHILCGVPKDLGLNFAERIYTLDDVFNHSMQWAKLTATRNVKFISFKHVDNGDGTMVRVPDVGNLTSYDHNNLFNELEQLNKNTATFMTVLASLIRKQGSTFEVDETATCDTSSISESVASSNDTLVSNKDRAVDNWIGTGLTDYDIGEIEMKQQNNKDLTEQEKMLLSRFYFIKLFGLTINAEQLDIVNPDDNTLQLQFGEFVKLFYGKEQQMKNALFIATQMNNTEETKTEAEPEAETEADETESNMITTKSGIRLTKRIIFEDAIKIITNSDKVNYSSLFEFETDFGIDDICEKLKSQSIYFQHEASARCLFGCRKIRRTSEITNKSITNKSLLDSMNTVFGKYAIAFAQHQKKNVDKKKKWSYKFSCNQSFDVARFKLNICETVPEFEQLFNRTNEQVDYDECPFLD
jgi:hypothetical protein